MRIAFLSFYNGQVDRGVEVAVVALARGLGRNHEVTVFQAGEKIASRLKTIHLSAEKNWPTDSSQSFFRKFYLDHYSQKIFLFTLKFLPYFFEYKYDVVIPTNGGWQVALVRLVTWLLGKKMLVQGNAGIGRDDLWQLLWQPDYFVAISPSGIEWVKKYVPWIRKVYIPYGVDVAQFKLTKAKRITLKKPIILCVAAFLPYKQIHLLIRAMIEVPKASLLIIGQGPLEKELVDMGEKYLGGRFQLLVGIPHDQLIGYYKAVDVFSLPSKSTEALGIVNIEAMAAGLPVVATDDKNRREILGEAGVFVNPEDSLEYSRGLELALVKKVGDKPQKQAEKYSWKKIIDQYETILKTML